MNNRPGAPQRPTAWTDVAEWRPEDPVFWASNKWLAIRTLIIACLLYTSPSPRDS